jgi:hypothetical protein
MYYYNPTIHNVPTGPRRQIDPRYSAKDYLAIAVLWMGLYPKPFTDVMQVSVSELLKHVAVSKLAP